MASKKDMKRPDLIIPYVETEKDANTNDTSSTISTTMPMMAMFTRNKMIGWVAMVFSLQTWLAETPEIRKNAATPGYLGVGMAILGLGTVSRPHLYTKPGLRLATPSVHGTNMSQSYMQLFMPPPSAPVAPAAPAAS